jgi:hypothetical protein
MPANAKPLVISAATLAGVGIVTALTALALRKYKQVVVSMTRYVFN